MLSLAKKISTLFFALVFVGVVFYTPYQVAKINTQYSFASVLGTGGYSEATGLLALIEQEWTAVQSTISAAADEATSFSTGSLWFKENVLDGIAWAVAKTLLSSITQSIVDWINSGFQGAPAFVTDLSGFLRGVADEAAGRYIDEVLGLGFLCSPFELDVRIAISLEYAANRENAPPACTLTDVVDNIESFLAGNFAEGGWAGWFEVTQRPQNTPYGSYIYAKLEFNEFVLRNQRGEEILLGFGDGFFSQTICAAIGDPGEGRENCTIAKPGEVIATQLNEALGFGTDSIIAADEFNEIIAALFGQLANQAVTGINGLLGLSSGNSYTDYSYADSNGQSFLDNLSIEQQGTVADGSEMDQSQRNLDEFDDYNQFVVSYVNNLEDDNDDNASRYPGCYSLSVPSSLRSRRTQAQNDISSTALTRTELNILQARLRNAENESRQSLTDSNPNNDITAAEVQQEVYADYQSLLNSGDIPTTVEIRTLEVQDRRNLQDDIASFRTRMNNEVDRCQQLQNTSSGGGGSTGGTSGGGTNEPAGGSNR